MASNGYAQIDETQPGYPPLPATSDGRWQPMVVHARSRSEGVLCSLPRLKVNFPVGTVHAGDIVAVMPQVRYGVWVAAKVDYSTGWLNTLHLEFTPYESEPFSLNTFDEEEFDTDNLSTKPYATGYHDDDYQDEHYHAAQAVTDEFIDQMREIGTRMDEPEQAADKPGKGEVNRIIGYLKGLFGRG